MNMQAMKKIFRMILILSAAATACLAATGKDVSYPSGDDTVKAVLYAPKGKGPFPALVVVHEWWGLNDWVKEQASNLADEGYETLAIDLYRGKVATTPELAHELMRGVPDDRAARDLHAAVEFLQAQSEVSKNRIGAIGWCMGGGYALDAALQEPALAAVVINYGHLADDKDDLKKMNAQVLGIFGGQDRGIPVEDVKKFEQELKDLGKNPEIHIYPDAGHGFQNPVNSSYRKEDTADAKNHIAAFLAKTLKK
jgi:carboxymethylenebutenolidase